MKTFKIGHVLVIAICAILPGQALALDDCPTENGRDYSAYSCADRCTDEAYGIQCTGQGDTDLFVAVTDDTYGAIIWGHVETTKTDHFCCLAADVGTVDKIFIDTGAGNDQVWLQYGDYNWDEDSDVELGDGNDTCVGSNASGYEDTIDGDADDDSICGEAGNDTIYGGAGGDALYGGTGNDTILAGLGDDAVDGGSGADDIDGSYGDDVLCSNTGIDTVNGSWHSTGDICSEALTRDSLTACEQTKSYANCVSDGGGMWCSCPAAPTYP